MSLQAGKVTQTSSAAFPALLADAKGGFDKLGVVMSLIAIGAFLLPFANFRASRIAQAKGVTLLDSVPAHWGWPSLIILLLTFLVFLRHNPAPLRLVIAAAAIVLLGVLIGLVPATLIAPDNARPRVGPAAGFWLLAFVFAILLTDAVVKLTLGPLQRILALGIAAAIAAAFLISGHWGGLSVMKEYATNGDNFSGNAIRHIELALLSLAGALVVGLPLGVVCHRSAKLREVILPVLNVIQTVPSIALFGLLMAPLSLLARSYPVLRDYGISGIGFTPALIALFLYALLPMVSNTVTGIASVPPGVVDAAKGMGMTPRQTLYQVELPLAFPVILTGVRIVLVQNIGLATIAAFIGGGGFGVYVQNGMGATAIDLVLLGAIPTIALAFAAAIILDAIVDILKGRHT